MEMILENLPMALCVLRPSGIGDFAVSNTHLTLPAN